VLGVYPNLLFKVSDGTIVNVAQHIAAATGN
jgi:NADH:ubiquinone oxidoreductase subunit 4 (subunit M)